MFNLKNKIILITGASGLIGSYLSINLEKIGCKLILVDNDKNKLTSLKKKIKKKTFTVNCDLSNRDEITTLCNSVKKKI